MQTAAGRGWRSPQTEGLMKAKHQTWKSLSPEEEMQKSQEELSVKEFEATAGGGAISVKVSGDKVIKEIKIKPEVVDPDDVEMLQDLILTCVNEALRKVDSAQNQEFGKYNIPGLM